jgi:hypothetical protein
MSRNQSFEVKLEEPVYFDRLTTTVAGPFKPQIPLPASLPSALRLNTISSPEIFPTK